METGSVFKMCPKISSFAAWGWHRACLNPLMKNTSLFEIREFDMFLLYLEMSLIHETQFSTVDMSTMNTHRLTVISNQSDVDVIKVTMMQFCSCKLGL